MTPDETTVASWVDAQAALLGVPLAPEHRPGVLRYAALAAQMAEVVMAVPLTVHDEPGHPFRPAEPTSAGDA
jgi:hypothetical protein